MSDIGETMNGRYLLGSILFLPMSDIGKRWGMSKFDRMCCMEGEKFNNPYHDDIVGVPTPEQGEMEAITKDTVKIIERKGRAKIEDFEIQKTARDVDILNFARESVEDLMKQYGREKDIDVPLSHIHILEPDGTKKYLERYFAGAHSTVGASILADRDPSDVQFCLTCFHEILHLKSFSSVQFTKTEKPVLKQYRSGLSVRSRDGKEVYFTDLEEGVIGLLSQKFYDTKLKSSPLFEEELKKGEGEFYIGRKKETEKLQKIVDELWEKNQDSFSSREEILDLFVDAQINGNLLTIGKLIERTFGKGSFREIGSSQLDS